MNPLLLLYPPATKPCEPPLGLAVLLAHLRRQGVAAEALDANLDAYLQLLQPEALAAVAGSTPGTAIQRALRHRTAALDLLRSPAATQNYARYETALHTLDRLLSLYRGETGRERLTLGDYQHPQFSPFVPEDLAAFAEGRATTLFHNYFKKTLLPRLLAARPRLIAISINYLNQALPAFELAGLLRRALPEVPLVAGGGLLTSWQPTLRELQLRLPPFDRVIFGPGEVPLQHLADGSAPADYFLADSSTTGFAVDYTFAELSRYLAPEPVVQLCSSRGCYWQRCLFCPEAATPVHPYTSAATGTLPGQMRRLADELGVRHFHLTDNAIPVAQLRQLAAAGAELAGLSWHGFVRFEAALEDAAFVRQLADSGCRMLQLGLESGSQRVLDRLGKGIALPAVKRILINLEAAGIASYVYVMLGIPGETKEDAELTRALLLEQAGRIDYLNLSIMNLPRSSGLLDDPQQHGIAAAELLGVDAPLGLYQSFTASSGWGRREARRFLDQRILSEPALRAIIQRTPPWFSSNHAVFFGRTAQPACAGKVAPL